MTEVTRIYTVEITDIFRDGVPSLSPDELKGVFAEWIKEMLVCDHVNVVKIQDFEMEVADEQS